jgi:peptide/nickel transport system substrate-binding protein
MKKLFIPLVILLIFTILLPACSKGTSTTTAVATTPAKTTPAATTPAATTTAPAETIVKGGTLRYIYPYSPISTPGWPGDDMNAQRMWMEWTVFEPLVKPDKQYQPTPWLATSWDWGPNNTYITFHLRENVLFHDGTPFTSEAVKLAGDLAMQAHEAFASTWASWDIIDDNTIRLTLNQYQNDFWGDLMGINMCFFSPTAYKQYGVDYMKEHPIGTGPFRFSSFEKDVSIKLVKFNQYWQPGKPYLDELDFITVKETLTAQSTMQAGEGDAWALQQGKTLYDMQNLGFTIVKDYGGSDFLMFDTMNEGSVTNDVRVREAIEYAIDKDAMIKAIGYGNLMKTNQWSPPTNPSFNPNLPSRDYDPAMARQLLADAGYPNGCDLHIITIGAEPEILAVQQYLEAVGFRVTLESVDNAKFWNYCMTGWTGVMNVGYAVGFNFPAALIGYYGPNRVIDKSVKIPDDILAKAQAALLIQDPVEAKAASDEVIKELYDICWEVFFYSNAMGFVLSPKLHDSGIEDFADWSQWSPENAWLEK